MKATWTFLAILLLSLLSWAGWFRYGNGMPEWLSIVLSLWNWLVGPVVVIWLAHLAKAELDFEDPKGIFWLLVRILVGGPLGFFGVVFILVGLSMMAFAIWAIFQEGEASTLRFLSAFGILAAGILLGGRMVYGAFSRSGPTRAEIEERLRLRAERLANPDWDLYERHLGRPVPEKLKEQFGTPEEFSFPSPFDDGESLEATWSPIHPSELLIPDEAEDGMEVLPFAWLAEGGVLFLLPGATTPDRVYLMDSGGGENVVLASPSIEDFCSLIRETESG